MLDPAIEAYFSERKEAWLKKNIKSAMEESEILEKQQMCEEIFSRDKWLPNAAKRAGQMSLATHPCTFSHPSSRKNKNGYANPIVANVKGAKDGFFRSGNVQVEMDALGNAAVLDVYKFLTLKMKDSRKLIEHLQNNSKLAVELLTIPTEKYETLKSGFLAILDSTDNSKAITSSKIKQVYFPVADSYHQLSILSNSGLLYKLRERIDVMRFSYEISEIRNNKRKNIFNEQGFSELYNLTTIGFGGTKPQNISVMNNRYGGKAHLLMSVPPTLKKRNIRFPTQNFFRESIRDYEYRDIFHALHKLFKTDYNNHLIREGRDYRIQSLVDFLIDRMWAVRSVYENQGQMKESRLELHQKIWLAEDYQQQRESEDDWLDTLCKKIAIWIVHTYKRLIGGNAYKLGDTEWMHIHEIVRENREALR